MSSHRRIPNEQGTPRKGSGEGDLEYRTDWETGTASSNADEKWPGGRSAAGCGRVTARAGAREAVGGGRQVGARAKSEGGGGEG